VRTVPSSVEGRLSRFGETGCYRVGNSDLHILATTVKFRSTTLATHRELD